MQVLWVARPQETVKGMFWRFGSSVEQDYDRKCHCMSLSGGRSGDGGIGSILPKRQDDNTELASDKHILCHVAAQTAP